MTMPRVVFFDNNYTAFTIETDQEMPNPYRYHCYRASSMTMWDAFVTKFFGWISDRFKTEQTTVQFKDHRYQVFMKGNEIARLAIETRAQAIWEKRNSHSKTHETTPLAARVNIGTQSASSSDSVHGASFSSAKPLAARQHPLSRKLRSLNNDACHGELVGVYITSNEFGLAMTSQALCQYPIKPGSCHIGFSGWYNFDIMAVRKSERGIICDFNPQNKRFIETTLQLLKTSPSREKFVEQLTQVLQRDHSITFSPNPTADVDNPVEEIQGELVRRGSWLSSDESFSHIRSLALSDSIVALTVDIRESERFQHMVQILRDNMIAIDSVYLSNIGSYMSSSDQEAYRTTVYSVIEDETLVIHCPKWKILWYPYEGPIQRVDLGKAMRSGGNDNLLFQVVEKDLEGRPYLIPNTPDMQPHEFLVYDERGRPCDPRHK